MLVAQNSISHPQWAKIRPSRFFLFLSLNPFSTIKEAHEQGMQRALRNFSRRHGFQERKPQWSYESDANLCYCALSPVTVIHIFGAYIISLGTNFVLDSTRCSRARVETQTTDERPLGPSSSDHLHSYILHSSIKQVRHTCRHDPSSIPSARTFSPRSLCT
jgi:hypothetical protein